MVLDLVIFAKWALFTLPKLNVESVNLVGSDIVIRRQYNTSISNNSTLAKLMPRDNEVFLPYDEERYTLIRSNGDTEILSDGDFVNKWFNHSNNQWSWWK